MHLCELQLGHRACSGWKRRVADDVAESLPLGLGGSDGFPFRVIENNVSIVVTPDIELLGPEKRHLGESEPVGAAG